MFITAYHTVSYIAGTDASVPVSTQTYSGMIKGCAYALDSVTSVALIIIAVIANDKANLLISPDFLKKIPVALLIASTKTTGIIWAATSAGSLSIQMVCVLVIDKPKQLDDGQNHVKIKKSSTEELKEQEPNHSPQILQYDETLNPLYNPNPVTPPRKIVTGKAPATERRNKSISVNVIRRSHSRNSLTNLTKEIDLTLSAETENILDKIDFKLNTTKELFRKKFEEINTKRKQPSASFPKVESNPVIISSSNPIDLQRPPQLVVDLETVQLVKATLKDAKNRKLPQTPQKCVNAMTRFQRSISMINMHDASIQVNDNDDSDWK